MGRDSNRYSWQQHPHQPKVETAQCPPTDDGEKALSIRTAGITTHATPWKNLEDNMLSEISQTQQDRD